MYTISGYSTALFSTWYFIEELNLLFDAGEGISSSLLQKSRKIKHAFISHADRDHLAGLLQFNQLNARPGYPVIYYPGDSGSFPAMEAFTKAFDPHVTATVWQPLTEESRIWIKDDVYVMPIRNGHVVKAGNAFKSLSYKVVQIKKKLKPEYLGLSQPEIIRIVEEKGKEATSYEVHTSLMGYSGDTPVEDLTRWEDTPLLIHEATFLGGNDQTRIRMHGNKHSCLDEVIEMVSGLNVEQLVLGHFSSRYTAEEIDRMILDLCEKYALKTKVYRLLPGQIVHDVLRQLPVYSGI
jgi:ribonuclease Z